MNNYELIKSEFFKNMTNKIQPKYNYNTTNTNYFDTNQLKDTNYSHQLNSKTNLNYIQSNTNNNNIYYQIKKQNKNPDSYLSLHSKKLNTNESIKNFKSKKNLIPKNKPILNNPNSVNQKFLEEYYQIKQNQLHDYNTSFSTRKITSKNTKNTIIKNSYNEIYKPDKNIDNSPSFTPIKKINSIIHNNKFKKEPYSMKKNKSVSYDNITYSNIQKESNNSTSRIKLNDNKKNISKLNTKNNYVCKTKRKKNKSSNNLFQSNKIFSPCDISKNTNYFNNKHCESYNLNGGNGNISIDKSDLNSNSFITNMTMNTNNNTYGSIENYWKHKDKIKQKKLELIRTERYLKESKELQDRPIINKNSNRIANKLISRENIMSEYPPPSVFDRLSDISRIKNHNFHIEKMRKQLTDTHIPNINKNSKKMKRTIKDLYTWQNKIQRKQNESTEHLNKLLNEKKIKTNATSEIILREKKSGYLNMKVEDRLLEQGRIQNKKNEIEREKYLINITTSKKYINNEYENIPSRYLEINNNKKNNIINKSYDKLYTNKNIYNENNINYNNNYFNKNDNMEISNGFNKNYSINNNINNNNYFTYNYKNINDNNDYYENINDNKNKINLNKIPTCSLYSFSRNINDIRKIDNISEKNNYNNILNLNDDQNDYDENLNIKEIENNNFNDINQEKNELIIDVRKHLNDFYMNKSNRNNINQNNQNNSKFTDFNNCITNKKIQNISIKNNLLQNLINNVNNNDNNIDNNDNQKKIDEYFNNNENNKNNMKLFNENPINNILNDNYTKNDNIQKNNNKEIGNNMIKIPKQSGLNFNFNNNIMNYFKMPIKSNDEVEEKTETIKKTNENEKIEKINDGNNELNIMNFTRTNQQQLNNNNKDYEINKEKRKNDLLQMINFSTNLGLNFDKNDNN